MRRLDIIATGVAFLIGASGILTYLLIAHANLGSVTNELAQAVSRAIFEASGTWISTVQPGQRFVMDGQIDQWLYGYYTLGLAKYTYWGIAIQEQGIFLVYWAILRLYGEFSTSVLVISNALFHLGSSCIVYAMVRRWFGGNGPASVVAAIFLFNPDTIFWSTTLGKDNLVILLIVICQYLTLSVVGVRNGWIRHVLIALTLVDLAFCRSSMVVPVLIAIALSLLVAGKHSWGALGKFVVTTIAVTTVFSIVFPQPIVKDIQRKAFEHILTKLVTGSASHLDVENITYRTTKEESFVTLFGGGEMNIGKAGYIPIRAAMYLIAPFPPLLQHTNGEGERVVSAVILTSLFPLFLLGVVTAIRDWNRPTLVLACYFAMIMTAVVFAGPYVYERYRLMMLSAYFPIAIAVAFTVRNSRRVVPSLLACGVGMYLIAFVAWWSLKGRPDLSNLYGG
jgi:hypothetical protein